MICEIIFHTNNFSLQDFRAIELSEFVFTDNFRIRQSFFDEKVIAGAGGINCYHPPERGFVYYNKDDSSISDKSPDYELREAVDEITNKKEDLLIYFLNCLWLIKDNSVSSGNVFGRLKNTPWAQFIPEDFRPSHASGEVQNTYFTLNDLEEANAIFKIYIGKIKSDADIIKANDLLYISDQSEIIRTSSKSFGVSFDHNKTNCVERAMHFLQMARKEDYLMYKIALYMPVLECLFITDHKEILQKMRYRIAFYIGVDRNDRKNIDDLISDCYDIRSKFIHGQIYTKDAPTFNELLEYSIKLDDLIRRILRHIITNDLARFIDPKKENREGYFNKLIYGIEGYPYRL